MASKVLTNDQKETLLSGYVRETMNAHIPVEMMLIIISFMQRLQRFKLNDKNGSKWVLKNDGLILSKIIKPGGSTVIFGDFLCSTNGDFGELIKFKCINVAQSGNDTAFGFCTNAFDQFTGYNNGNNSSVILRGQGYFQTSKCFLNPKGYAHDDYIESMAHYFKKGEDDTVCVAINMIDRIGRIWNEQRPQNVFEIGFGKNEQIAIIVYISDAHVIGDMIEVIEQNVFLSEHQMQKSFNFL